MSSVGLLHPQIDVEAQNQAIKESIADGRYQPQLSLPEPLYAMDTISDVWPERPPNNRLHVFISLPSEAKRPRLDDVLQASL
jgi:hypothetical protein